MGFCFDIIAVNPKFHHQKCEDVTDVLINEWRLEGEGMLANDGLLYPYKIPSDFQECPFKISMSHCKLPEVSHMTAFSKRPEAPKIRPFSPHSLSQPHHHLQITFLIHRLAME